MDSLFKQMPVRHRLAVTLATLHLVLVACNAAHLPPSLGEGVPGRLLQGYTLLAGAYYQFGFFAPGVASEMQVSFEVEKGSGEVVRESFAFANHEVKLRTHSMLIHFGFEELQDLLARSWAAVMFGRHPDARSVTVIVEVFDLPTMVAYDSGARPAWKEYYRAVVKHQSPSSSSQVVMQ